MPAADATSERDLLDPFDAFWAAYPRKDGKIAARAAFVKALQHEKPSVITAAAAQYAADPNRDPAYTPYAQKWLKEGRWDAAPLPERPGRRRGYDDKATWGDADVKVAAEPVIDLDIEATFGTGEGAA